MNFATKLGLNLMQRARLDNAIIGLLNKKHINRLMLRHCWQHKGYKHFYKKYLSWREILEKNQVNLAGKKILEVGSGASLGLAYFFLNQGYVSWLASDFFQDLPADDRAIKREIKLINKIAAVHGGEISRQAGTERGKLVFGEKLGFKKLDLTEFNPGLEKKFDLIISSDVLEHLTAESVGPAINNLALYLKPGALMIHEIDLRDHINVANPHNFLKYSGSDWNKLARGTIFYTNRLRLKDYLEIFNGNKLKVKFLRAEEKPLPVNIKISGHFDKYDKKELAVTRVFIILEKII